MADGYLPREDAYFFQRSPLAFDSIFQYYATGVVHRPPEMCPLALAAELEFWRISPQSIGSCCAEDIAPLPKLAIDEDENVCYRSYNIFDTKSERKTYENERLVK